MAMALHTKKKRHVIEATLVVRGGTVYDGTGNPPFVADVAINGELIVAVGTDLSVGVGCEEIDAQGKMVAPGWIDPHTHYDAQVG